MPLQQYLFGSISTASAKLAIIGTEQRNNEVISKGTPRENPAEEIKQFPSIVRTCLSLTQGCVASSYIIHHIRASQTYVRIVGRFGKGSHRIRQMSGVGTLVRRRQLHYRIL